MPPAEHELAGGRAHAGCPRRQGGAAAQIKQVLALAAGAGAAALLRADMRERMLDGDTLAQLGPSR